MGRFQKTTCIFDPPRSPVAKSEYVDDIDLIQLNPGLGSFSSLQTDRKVGSIVRLRGFLIQIKKQTKKVKKVKKKKLDVLDHFLP